jgi:hypothetical protein
LSWADHHSASESLAAQAELAARRGLQDEAKLLYAQAAGEEVHALFDLTPEKTRTLGVTVVSAVALWFRAKEYRAARKLAHHWLATDQLPEFAEDELQILLQAIWSASSQETAGVEFVEGDVIVAVKGGEIVFGGAPLDLVVRKVEEVKAMFYRIAELLLRQPHRKRGVPSAEVQAVFQPWLFQAPAGSYQFALRVRRPPQLDLFPEAGLQVSQVVSTFLSVLKSSVEDPEGEFRTIVDDAEYQETFLKLARNLAPTGEKFGQIEFRDPTRLLPDPVALLPEARKHLNEAIRARRPKREEPETRIERVRGVLRAVHLDEDWLEVATVGPELAHIRVTEVGDVVDDVIGPMINQVVVVEAQIDARGRYLYRDIELVE